MTSIVVNQSANMLRKCVTHPIKLATLNFFKKRFSKMFRNYFRSQKFLYASILTPFTTNREDITVTKHVPNDTDLNGWERIRNIFKRDEFDQMNPKLAAIAHLTISGMFMGGCYGGITHSMNTYRDFIRKNTMTAFISNYSAQRKLQQAIFVTFITKGATYAGKFAIFLGMYSFVSTFISTYRGYESTLDYIAGATVAGSLYRVSLGLRGMLAGGFLGFLLGTFFGTIITLCERIFKLSLADVQENSYRINTNRRVAEQKLLQANLQNEGERNFPMLREHRVRTEQLELTPDLGSVE